MPHCNECVHCAEKPVDPARIQAAREIECRFNPPQVAVILTREGPVFASVFPSVNEHTLCSKFILLTPEPKTE